jgi:DNA-binding transcriptional MerR regulator
MALELRRPERTFTIRQLCVEFFYSYRDRGRLVLILRGKRVGLSLAEIRDILQLYDKHDGGVTQNALALAKFRERIVALERQREDIDHSIDELRGACDRLEKHLAKAPPPAERSPALAAAHSR